MPSLRRLSFAPIDVAGAGDNTLVNADAKNKIKVVTFFLVASGAVAVRFKSGAGTNLTGAMALAANGGVAVPAGSDFAHLFETAVNQALVMNLGGAVQVSGGLVYVLEPQ
jgi:hypothetical protein